MAQVNTTMSVLFDGVGDRLKDDSVTAALRAAIRLPGGKVWLEVWFKTTTTAFGWLVAINDPGAGKPKFRIRIGANGKLLGSIERSSVTSTPESVLAFNDDVWHQAILITEGNILYLVMDGAEGSPSGAISGTALDTITRFEVGVQTTSNHYAGNLTQIRAGIAYTDTRATLISKLFDGSGQPVDVSELSGIGLHAFYELPAVTPPSTTAELGLDNGTPSTDLDVIVGLTTADAVLDYPGPTDPIPTVDFCNVTVRLSFAVAGVVVEARTDVRSYFLADVPINAASAKAHNPDRTVRAVTNINGIAVLNLPTINNRRTGQAEDSWTVNIPQTKYSRRIQVPDQATAELADITID